LTNFSLEAIRNISENNQRKSEELATPLDQLVEFLGEVAVRKRYGDWREVCFGHLLLQGLCELHTQENFVGLLLSRYTADSETQQARSI
jgi:hypothetical protein